MIRPIEESNCDKLTLALEPEVAAIYARYDTTERLRTSTNVTITEVPTKYMVVDIGGGTVDITVHHNAEGSSGINVVTPPCGNAMGGNMINKAFQELMTKSILNDVELENYYTSNTDKLDTFSKESIF